MIFNYFLLSDFLWIKIQSTKCMKGQWLWATHLWTYMDEDKTSLGVIFVLATFLCFIIPFILFSTTHQPKKKKKKGKNNFLSKENFVLVFNVKHGGWKLWWKIVEDYWRFHLIHLHVFRFFGRKIIIQLYGLP